MFASQIVKFLITWFEDFLQGATEEIPPAKSSRRLHMRSAEHSSYLGRLQIVFLTVRGNTSF